MNKNVYNEATNSTFISLIPTEIQVSILGYLRAFDLASVQQTCRHFHSPEFITNVIHHTATQVYPPDLTDGFDHIVRGKAEPKDSNGHFTNYEPMRDIETLVVARVLSRPEPPYHERSKGFYVSKAWCKTALQWLESQQQQQLQLQLQLQQQGNGHGHGKKKGRKEKKKARIRARKLSDVLPPWPNVNHDLTCEHGDLKHCSSKSARARRRVMDKQAWKVLKKLYPDSIQLRALQTECLQCALEAETVKKTAEAQKEMDKSERRKPLSNPLIRAIYTRANKGVPLHALVSETTKTAKTCACPLKPGIYTAVPRAWCHKWRKYLKSGGEKPNAPDGSALLCDAHKLPLVPNHLEAFLYGDNPQLLCAMANANHNDREGLHDETMVQAQAQTQTRPTLPSSPSLTPSSRVATVPTTMNASTTHDGFHFMTATSVEDSMIAAGMTTLEIETQRLALRTYEQQQQPNQIHTLSTLEQETTSNSPAPSTPKSRNNDLLDRENQVVVEILTEQECNALEEWWPDIHSSFVMKFAVVEHMDGVHNFDITWSTNPCRECDAGHSGTSIVVRNRTRKAVKGRSRADPFHEKSYLY